MHLEIVVVLQTGRDGEADIQFVRLQFLQNDPRLVRVQFHLDVRIGGLEILDQRRHEEADRGPQETDLQLADEPGSGVTASVCSACFRTS